MKTDKKTKKGRANVITTDPLLVPPSVENGSKHIDIKNITYSVLLDEVVLVGRNILNILYCK